MCQSEPLSQSGLILNPCPKCAMHEGKIVDLKIINKRIVEIIECPDCGLIYRDQLSCEIIKL
jgi:uncharacterized Zn finger protein